MNVWRWTATRWCYRKAEAESAGGMRAFEFELCGASERSEAASGFRRDHCNFRVGYDVHLKASVSHQVNG
jgi:hypothetical protein